MLRALLIGLVILAATVAHAGSGPTLGDGGGYAYPKYSGTCSPACQGVSASWIVNDISYTGSGSNEQIFQWIGVTATASQAGCNGHGCLGQFGTLSKITPAGVKTFQAWWELFCSPVASPCNNVQTLSTTTFHIAAGDKMIATMECVANCTRDNAGEEWALSLQNVTRGWTWNNSGTNFNWQLAMDMTEAVIETTSTGSPDWGSSRFSDFLVDQGSGLVPPALTPASGTFSHNGSGASEKYSTASPLFGKSGADFNVCFTQTQFLASATCNGGPYTTNVGIGP